MKSFGQGTSSSSSFAVDSNVSASGYQRTVYRLPLAQLRKLLTSEERQRGPLIDGFRLGKAPLGLVYRLKKDVLTRVVLDELKANPPNQLHQQLGKAVVPLTYRVLEWDEQSEIAVEVTAYSHPGVPRPGFQHKELLKAAAGLEPDEPSPVDGMNLARMSVNGLHSQLAGGGILLGTELQHRGPVAPQYGVAGRLHLPEVTAATAAPTTPIVRGPAATEMLGPSQFTPSPKVALPNTGPPDPVPRVPEGTEAPRGDEEKAPISPRAPAESETEVS